MWRYEIKPKPLQPIDTGSFASYQLGASVS